MSSPSDFGDFADSFGSEPAPTHKPLPPLPTDKELSTALAETKGHGLASVLRRINQQAFRDICTAATWAFWETGEQPTPQSMVKYLAHHPRDITSIKKTMASPEFTTFLQLRGIWTRGPLSERQLLALQMLTDMSSTATLKGRLQRASIPWWEFQAWLRQPAFSAEMHRFSDAMLTDAIPLAKQQIAQQATNGRFEAIKYLMEITGVHDPARRQAMDVQMVVGAIMESLMAHVTDMAALAAVAKDIRRITAKAGIPDSSPGSGPTSPYAVIDASP